MVGDQGAVLAQRVEAADDGVDPVVGGAVQRAYPDRVVRAARALEGPHRTECRRHIGVGEEGLDVYEFDENRLTLRA